MEFPPDFSCRREQNDDCKPVSSQGQACADYKLEMYYLPCLILQDICLSNSFIYISFGDVSEGRQIYIFCSVTLNIAISGLENLPTELQRNFHLMRDLDQRSQDVMRNIDQVRNMIFVATL